VIFLTSTVADLFRPANGASITFLSPAALHKRAFALNRLAVNLGFTVGPLVGGMLAFYSYQWLFWVNAITCLLAAGLFQLLLGSHLTDHPESQNEKAMGIASGVIGTSPFADGKYLLFLLLNFITFCVFFQLISTYPLFLEKEFFLNEFEIGMLLGLNTIIVVLFEMVLIQSIDHCSALKTIAWGSLLMCLGFGVLPLGFGFGFTALTVLIWTLGEMLAMPQMFAYVSSISNRQNRSRYLGLYTLSVSLALVCGPWVGTRLYTLDHFQFWHWGTVIGCGVFSGFYAMAWHEQRTRRQRKLAAETV
jgi:MFS family permease